MKLNCDLGEGMDEIDARVIPHIDMASIACGGHAGDDSSMLRTITLCQRYQTAIGAHPSYPDREHFGRRSLTIAPPELAASLSGQILHLRQHCHSLGTELSYVKPHGALYNDAMSSPELFDILLTVIKRTTPDLPLLILATPRNGALEKHARESGVRLWFEAFADRLYTDDGKLVSRKHTRAVHSDIELIAEQAWLIANHHYALSENGNKIPVHAQSLCVHSDSPNAIEAIAAIRKKLPNPK